MKRIICFIGAIMLTVTASAQVFWNATLTVGPYQNIQAKRTGYDKDCYEVNQSMFKIGLGLEKPLTRSLSITTGLELAIKSYDYEKGHSDYKSLDFYGIQIPVNIATHLPVARKMDVMLKAGPYVALGATSANNNSTHNTEVGINAGANFEFKRYSVGIEYERGLTKLAEMEEIGESVYSSCGCLIFGYRF